MSHVLSNRYVMAGATLAVALGIGFVMQRGAPDPMATAMRAASAPGAAGAPTAPAPGARDGAGAPRDAGADGGLAAAPAQPARPATDAVLTDIHFTSATIPPRPAPAPRPAPPLRDAAAERPAPQEAAAESAPAPACDVTLEAEPAPAATVRLTLDAPCLPDERLTLHHDGLMFTAVTDAEGALTLRAPALTSSAVYIAAFPNGDGAVAQATVPDAGARDRVALQWRGEAALHLHAFEGDARHGAPGHVWAGAPRAPETDGGFLMRLGAPDVADGRVAEVYTFPAEPPAGGVTLTVEAEVTEATCGTDIAADTLALRDGTAAPPREVAMFMPDCSAVGDFLVLKTLFDDRKIAAE